MKKSTYDCLVEALRRYCSFHAGTRLKFAWLGLGTEATYRTAINDGYFRWLDGQVPASRKKGWLLLTEEGERVILSWLARGYHVEDFHKFVPSLPPKE